MLKKSDVNIKSHKKLLILLSFYIPECQHAEPGGSKHLTVFTAIHTIK